MTAEGASPAVSSLFSPNGKKRSKYIQNVYVCIAKRFAAILSRYKLTSVWLHQAWQVCTLKVCDHLQLAWLLWRKHLPDGARVTSMTCSCEWPGSTLSLAKLLRYNLALVELSRATKLTARLETMVFTIVKNEPFFTSMPLGAWLSLENTRASCPMLFITFKTMKYFSPSPSDPTKQITNRF